MPTKSAVGRLLQGPPLIDAPEVIRTSAQITAVIHLTVPSPELRSAMGPGLSELMATLASQGIAPAGPWFTHHLGKPGLTFDFEIGVPVTEAVVPEGRVTLGQLPAARVARTVYWGPYEELPEAWKQFEAWIAGQGFSSEPDLWEVYQVGPDGSPDPSTWRTQLNRPLVE